MIKRLVLKKTFWSGLALIGVGITTCIQGDMAEGIQSIIAGVTAITLRDAISKIE